MRHKMLTQRALFCHRPKTGTLSQHFVTHVVPPLAVDSLHIATPKFKGVGLGALCN